MKGSSPAQCGWIDWLEAFKRLTVAGWTFKDGDLVNITVVDDQGDRVRSYMTNAFEVYHPQEVTSQPIRQVEETP